ncbi:MAG TPA: hypothetical protein VF006_17585 [Longimicrobium sp.]
MKSWIPADSLHAALLSGLASTAEAAAPRAMAAPAAAAAAPAQPADEPPPLPPQVAEWLAQLTLLYGVPFEYLVPDVRMLPAESMRFFYVDRNWLDRLTDGAMSIGVNGTRENVFNEAFFQSVYDEVDEAQVALRSALRGGVSPGGTPVGGPLSGLLFRSVVVSAWPGLEVKPTAGSVELQTLRMDHVAADVLLCIFNGVPDRVEVIEPGEGLHFGVIGGSPLAGFTVNLRGLGFPDTNPYPAGEQIQNPRGSGQYLTAAGSVRTGAGQPPGVLNVAGLVASAQAAMQPLGALGPGGTLTPGGFAIQLVRGAGLQAFDRTTAAAKAAAATPSAAEG